MDRYARNKALPEIGDSGQNAISDGRVLVVGAGALGSVCAMYLAGAGVGEIGVADFDTVDISNLQRQVAYTEDDAGLPKAEVLCRRLQQLNSQIHVSAHRCLVSSRNLAELLENYDVVADCTDNPASKHFLATAVPALGKMCVTAGIDGFVVQVATTAPGATTFADIFGVEPPSESCGTMVPCAQAGVFGPAAGMAATAQAAEALKILSGAGKPLINKLLRINTLDMSAVTLDLS